MRENRIRRKNRARPAFGLACAPDVNQGEFWAAYFAPSDPTHQVVYALDVAGGIDVLKFDRSASSTAVSAPARAIARTTTLTPHPIFRFACPLAI